MKTNYFTTKLKILVVLSTLIFTFSACDKDDDEDDKTADYVGTWSTEQTLQTDIGTFEVRDILTLAENSFTEVAKIKNPVTNTWVDYIGRKGTFTVSSDELNVSLTEAGATAIDISGNPTGQIVYYKAGTPEFTALLTEFEMTKDYKAKYTVSGNTLTLKADNNNNGSFDDEDEVLVFTKQ